MKPAVPWWRWVVVLVPGLLLYFFPVAGLSRAQAHVFGIFVAAIVALVAQPVKMGVSVVLAMTLLAVTGALPPAKVLSGFSNVVVWLIFTAFLFSKAITATGLGSRIGYLFIERFGRTPLRLGYSIAAADLVLAPFIPSDTARGGGVICPITRSVAEAFGAQGEASSGRMGAFLILTAFHTTYTASAMFLTSMAANPLIAEMALKVGHAELSWLGWLSGSILPGVLALIVLPWLLLRLMPPGLTDTAPARAHASEQLRRMGALSRRERWLALILGGVMLGWVTSPWHGINNTFVALMGLCAILLAGVVSWEDLLGEGKAWDALIWFAPLVMMSEVLNENGTIRVLSQRLFGALIGWPWPAALFVLVAAYCYVHYGFASMTAQVTALYPGFLAAALAAGVPPVAAALPLAYFSSLDAAMTHYGTGSAPVYFGAGYVRQGEWWRVGFLISLVNLFIWLGIGSLWWKLIGIW